MKKTTDTVDTNAIIAIFVFVNTSISTEDRHMQMSPHANAGSNKYGQMYPTLTSDNFIIIVYEKKNQ